jgi:bis(5'-nucleosyl)-tetraphosphatase (symmetrical)
MATYAIGDVQGCLDSLTDLLREIAFDAAHDRLWFTGDLVNRGPDSLGVLRLVHALDACSVTVLGNHDLHLLATRYVPQRRQKKGDTLDAVLAARDCDSLLAWLRQRPLFYHDHTLGMSLVHAGVPVDWTIDDALQYARQVETALRGNDFLGFLENMYGNTPARWSRAFTAEDRLRYITNCFTRMRFCKPDGRLDFKTKEGLTTPLPDLIPWFMLPNRAAAAQPIVFGHWSTLRLSAHQERQYKVFPLDTGAVWGGELTALRLEDGARFKVRGWHAQE